METNDQTIKILHETTYDNCKDALKFYRDCKQAFFVKEVGRNIEIPIDYRRPVISKLLQVPKVYMKSLEKQLLEYLESDIKAILDHLQDEVKEVINRDVQTGLQPLEFIKFKIRETNNYLNKKDEFYSSKERKEADEKGILLVKGTSQYGPKYFIDEINTYIDSGGTLLGAMVKFPFDKLSSTIALKRHLKWLESYDVTTKESKTVALSLNGYNWTLMSEKLNEGLFTKNCNAIQLSNFVNDIESNTTIHWIDTPKKGNIKLQSLLYFIYVIDNELLGAYSRSVLYNRICSNFIGVNSEEVNRNSLKNAVSRFLSKSYRSVTGRKKLLKLIVQECKN